MTKTDMPSSKSNKPTLIERILVALIPVRNEVDAAGLDWDKQASELILEQNPIRTRALLYSVGVTVVLLLVWAAYSPIDEVTRGSGKVIPSTQVQILQSLDGGVITNILVSEGDLVEAGQLLVKLDATRFKSNFEENQVDYFALQAKAERLAALSELRPVAFSQELKESLRDIVVQETSLYESRLAQLNAEQDIVGKQLVQKKEELSEAIALRDQSEQSALLTRRELSLTEPLVSSGAASEVELLRLERDVAKFDGQRKQADAQIKQLRAAIAEAQGKIARVELDFRNENLEELIEISARINALEKTSLGLSDRVAQTFVKSPMKGTIKRLHLNTIGGVVLPGDDIVEVVPFDDTLLLEARIHPKDIGFLRPGQDALVRFTAYDFVVYGGLQGRVEHIGADTVLDENGDPFYTIRVRTDRANVDEDKPIIPGMVAEVDVLTGKKTILAYLLKPILRAKQYALTER